MHLFISLLAPEECPAGKTDCAQKNTGPIGFSAGGQVCTTSGKCGIYIIGHSFTRHGVSQIIEVSAVDRSRLTKTLISFLTREHQSNEGVIAFGGQTLIALLNLYVVYQCEFRHTLNYFKFLKLINFVK